MALSSLASSSAGSSPRCSAGPCADVGPGPFDQVIGLGHAGKLAWMFAGGLFIGFGTRLAGGCTSGHGIFGMSNFERPSLVSTLSFMAAGILTTQIVYRVIFAVR